MILYDEVVLYDNENYNYEGYTFYDVTLTDTVSVSDNIIKATARSLSETLNLSDNIVKGTFKTITDTLELTDVFSRFVEFTRTLVDNVGILDVLQRKVNGTSTIWSSRIKTSTQWGKRTLESLFLYDDHNILYDVVDRSYNANIVYTLRSKPEMIFTKRTKPNTAFTERTQPQTQWDERGEQHISPLWSSIESKWSAIYSKWSEFE
jgi:hypothetical protein